MFRLGYLVAISFGLWQAAANSPALDIFAAAALGMVYVVTGCGFAFWLHLSERRQRAFVRWVCWFVLRIVSRPLLLAITGRCNAVDWRRWLRCTREPGHPNLHVHAQLDFNGIVVRLIGCQPIVPPGSSGAESDQNRDSSFPKPVSN